MTGEAKPEGGEVKMPARVKAAVRKQAEVAAALRETRRVLAVKRMALANVERSLEILRRAVLPMTREVWCADLTEWGGGEVATLEVPGEPQRYLIAPGCPAPQASDGRIEGRATLDANQAFFNAALLPGVQKWRPDYRVGVIEAIDYPEDVATVLLDDARSSADALPINQAARLERIPVIYMSCHAGAFEVGDRVLVAFHERKWGQAYVCGFESHPRACTKPWVLLWVDAPAAWDNPVSPKMLSGIGRGKPFDENGVGTALQLNPVTNPTSGRRELDYEAVRFCAIGLDAQGSWHSWPWLNSAFALHGAGLRPGNWTQRVYLAGRKKLLQFAGMTRAYSPNQALVNLLGSEFDGLPVITMGAKDYAVGPDAVLFFPDCTESQLKGVSIFRDAWGAEWTIAVMYLRAAGNPAPLGWNDYLWHGWAVFARGAGGVWQLIGQDVHAYEVGEGWEAWAWAADQQWRFHPGGAEAALVANNAVRRLVLGSAVEGMPPLASFDWHPAYQGYAYPLDRSFSYDPWPPISMEPAATLMPGSADYDAKTGAVRVSFGADVDGMLGFPSWVDNRFGVELWQVGDDYQFRRTGRDPVSWGAVGSLAFICFDGAAGIAGVYIDDGSWKVLRFNAAGHVMRDDWPAAPAVYRGMAHGFPMVVGTTEEVWR